MIYKEEYKQLGKFLVKGFGFDIVLVGSQKYLAKTAPRRPRSPSLLLFTSLKVLSSSSSTAIYVIYVFFQPDCSTALPIQLIMKVAPGTRLSLTLVPFLAL